MNNSSFCSPSTVGLSLAYGTVLFEFLVDLIGLPISLLNFYTIYRTSVIHRNLKFILLCQSASFVMRFLLKLGISMPIRLLGPNILWHESANPLSLLLFYSNISFRSLLGHVIVLERTMATLLARKYEQNRQMMFSVSWISIVSLIVGFNVVSQQLLPQSNPVKQTFVTVSLSYGALLLSLVEITFFIILWLYNKKKYRKANVNATRSKITTIGGPNKSYALTERYQQLENIRTGVQLVPTLICHFLFLLDIAQGQTIVIFGLIPNPFYEALMVQVTNMLDGVISLMAEITMIMMHPFLRRDIRVLLIRLFKGNRVDIGTAVSCGDIRMQMMMRESTMEGHFQMLRNNWNENSPAAKEQFWEIHS